MYNLKKCFPDIPETNLLLISYIYIPVYLIILCNLVVKKCLLVIFEVDSLFSDRHIIIIDVQK